MGPGVLMNLLFACVALYLVIKNFTPFKENFCLENNKT